MIGYNRWLATPVKSQLAIRRTKQLGFVDPATATMIAGETKNLLQNVLSSLTNLFGAGRREADIIVPIQNDIANTVLAPIARELEYKENLSYSELTMLLEQLNESEKEWLAFLRDPQFTDGRASMQAEATLKPIFDSLRSQIKAELATKGGTLTQTFSNLFSTTGTSGVSPLLMGGLLVFGLSKIMKKRG